MMKLIEKNICLEIIKDELKEMKKENKDPKKNIHYLVKNCTLRYITSINYDDDVYPVIYPLINGIIQLKQELDDYENNKKERDNEILFLINDSWENSEIQDRGNIIRNAEQIFQNIKKILKYN